MGMFDYLQCQYPLHVDGANALQYQTKSLDCEMDFYEIRADGTLWRQDYDVEDHSDPTAEGLMRLRGMMARVRKRWEPFPFLGEVRFYSSFKSDWSDWIEWSAYFRVGVLKELHVVELREAPVVKAAQAAQPPIVETAIERTGHSDALQIKV